MVSAELLAAVRCPSCQDEGTLQAEGETLRCTLCGTAYPRHPAYLDLMPRTGGFGHTSRYISEAEEFAATLDYRTVGPPLLAAGVRQQVLRRMLPLRPADRVLDCGCGNGKFALWNHDRVALMAGLDPATLYADAALEQVDLVRGDARRMPFGAASFDKAFSLDVFEHLTLPDLQAVLAELRRVLCPGGWLLVYSNTREPSRLQALMDASRRLGAALRRRRLVGPERDALRKADHVKCIATFEELAALVQGHGFRIVRVRFWNSVITTFIEHLLIPLLERQPRPRSPRPAVSLPGGEEAGGERARWREHASRRGPFYWAARSLTWLMGLDLALFGRLRSGSYFVLLERA